MINKIFIYQIALSDATNPLLVKIIMLNNIYNLLGIFIITFVGCGLISAGFNMLVDKNFINHNQGEFICTYIPIIILFMCGMKSLQLLYFIERNQHRDIGYTLKIVQIFLELILTY